jgi:hypothetical protein
MLRQRSKAIQSEQAEDQEEFTDDDEADADLKYVVLSGGDAYREDTIRTMSVGPDEQDEQGEEEDQVEDLAIGAAQEVADGAGSRIA